MGQGDGVIFPGLTAQRDASFADKRRIAVCQSLEIALKSASSEDVSIPNLVERVSEKTAGGTGVRQNRTRPGKATHTLSLMLIDSSQGCCAAYDTRAGSSTVPLTTSNSPSKPRRTARARE